MVSRNSFVVALLINLCKFYREMWHDSVPFDNNIKLAKNYVLQEDARPGIMEEVDDEITKIIRHCW